jgi:hypothetical protein
MARKKTVVDPNQADLFSEHPAGPNGDPADEETLRDVHEVFAFTREQLGLPTPPGGPPDPDPPPVIAESLAWRTEEAEARGLVAKWSKMFGYISVHDPTSGTWHDVPTASAEAWMKWEAGTRKTMYKAGRRDAYDLTSADMALIWADENTVKEEEGIIEEHPLMEGDEE